VICWSFKLCQEIILVPCLSLRELSTLDIQTVRFVLWRNLSSCYSNCIYQGLSIYIYITYLLNNFHLKSHSSHICCEFESINFYRWIICAYFIYLGYAVTQLFEALRYKPGGRWFDSRLFRRNFYLSMAPGVDSASNRNEYQGYFLVGKGGRCVGLTNIPPLFADCLEIWEPQHPATLRVCPGL